MSLRLAIMITTHNRLSELERTIGVLRTLKPQPDQLLITADGCNDGTGQWIRKNVPHAVLIENKNGKGSIPSRDRMIRETDCHLVLSLDDDSYPIEKDAIAKLKNWFDNHSGVAVATFPLITEEYPESLNAEFLPALGYSATFPNCAACFDTGIYRQLPGFPTKFFHAYEEPDYALQAIANNFTVIHTDVIRIRHHWTSLGRNEMRVHHLHARNELWSALIRAPLPWAFGVISYRLLSQFRFALKRGARWVICEPVWWWSSLKGVSYCCQNRNPVTWKRYKLWLSLLRNPVADESNWKRLLETGRSEENPH